MATRARQRLLATAEDLFYAEGVRAVGLERLLSESGVGRASFYRHFASKDDLVLAVLTERDERWLAWLREAVEAVDEPADRPLAVFDALAQRFARKDFRGCAFINTMIEVADPDAPAHRVADRHKRRVIEYLGELLTAAGRTDAEELAGEFALLIDGAIVTALRENSPAAAERAGRIAARLLAD
ncbi:TetR/AcrR family transcriptional regulator [Nocardia cyriacigeorgica]|jgi:AcrR family transcriptional regulator|uniref:TetR/AcrR family transcriptional regulator n=1 Tax=Nocardia cyriacigeorgica TaxID=135487 RepID=UPI000CEA075D|nr:TetR family transcriptional regulator [Nocardia cyriacigeorgica]AVH23410.1 TetR family transcriptional regulator [Nocardia cyriacigeorgica]MBF6322981.1 TetR/AcrR family transcriptional regulator [Nocardia cyriacigeorgica]MBF6497350.1 TetR/AcrR family transcriptional regulator [Nocardia cyriacigeorgica]PPJ15451.1 TetR family transcriptional regulator [Nocardia cyriacigeorgica]